MSLAPIAGHTTIRAQLSDAVASGRLPQVLLVTGARGVGKQRLALWLGQLLLCEKPAVEPCGVCSSCRQVLGLTHPDLHWFVPVATPKGDADKQVEEVAAMLEAVMAERRSSPLWTAPDGMASHSIASARLVHRHASLTSVAGGWRVFIIGGADRLVPQESSPAAANSLLKLLEEPPQRSLFVLTTTAPGLVLPTIRSRSMPIRLGRLADDEVHQFLSVAKPELATESVVAAANGSIGAAVASGDGRTKANAAADDFLTAVAAGRAQAMERVLRQGAWAARGEFTALLDALADRLAERARRVLLPAGRRVTSGNPAGMLAGVERVLVARERAQGNVNPQLLLAVLASELSELAAV